VWCRRRAVASAGRIQRQTGRDPAAAAGRLPAVGLYTHPNAAPLILDAATGDPPTTDPSLPPTPK